MKKHFSKSSVKKNLYITLKLFSRKNINKKKLFKTSLKILKPLQFYTIKLAKNLSNKS